MDPAIWRGDCGRCAALCCLSLAFDRAELFAFDKAAGVPCSLLGPRHRCVVHAEREAGGWGGCAGYDCLGAGQRVTQEVFGGRSWRDDPALIQPMMDAFWIMRRVQEARQLVHLSARLPLTPAQAKRRDELERALYGRAKSGRRKRLRWAPGAMPVVRLNRRRKNAASS